MPLTRAQVVAYHDKLLSNYPESPELGELIYKGLLADALPDKAPAPTAKRSTAMTAPTPDSRIEALRLGGLSLDEAIARAREMDAEDSIAANTAALAADQAAFHEAHPDKAYDPFADWRAADADARTSEEILADYAKQADADKAARDEARDGLTDRVAKGYAEDQAKRDMNIREGAARQALLDQGFTAEQALKAIPEGSIGSAINADATPEQIERLAKWRVRKV